MRVDAEAWVHCLAEGHSLASYGVLEWATLAAWEHRLIDLGGVLGLRQNATTARSAQGLVRSERDDVCIRHRVGVSSARDEAGQVGHIEHEQRAHFVGNALEDLGVETARVAGGASNDHLGAMLERKVAHLVVVDALVAGVNLVRHKVVEDAAGIHGRAVGEMAAVIKAEAHHGVAGLEQTEIDRHVGAGTTVRLHVGVLGAEQLFDA